MVVVKLVIGNKNYSSWSLRPWLLMRHFGIDFEEQRISLFREDTFDLLSPLSPTLKVPVLHHGDTLIWDSQAICEYVNEQFLEGMGWPSEASARGVARSACSEMHSGFSVLRERWPMNCRLSKPMRVDESLRRDILRMDALWQECLGRYGGEEGYLFNEFSIADCFFAPVVMRFVSYQPELSDTALTYMSRMQDNTALQEWVAAGRQESEVIDEDEVDFLSQLRPDQY